ncbi:acetyl-CoA carboxylase biotin carboxyl carrier protein subunit [Cupriavidus sp. 30B13]|uniref:acetyl-CoA carboxylase biotin carboxyl carrier protein subunit n=1 Tax=Cupriavidus sp. 30B13 TaxID=3384241 RepID=UPI003B90CA3F
MSDRAVLIDKGFDLALGFLSYLREKDERKERIHMATLESQKELHSRFLSSLDDMSRKLDNAAQEIVSRLSQKLESDQLENLIAQIKALRFALGFSDKDMLRSTLVGIMAPIEYSRSRIAERKYEWLGPWMAAESIRIIGLREIAPNENAIEMVKKEAMAFRLNLLDYTGHFIINAGSTPWREIANFVDGKSEDVLRLIKNATKISAPDTNNSDVVITLDDMFGWESASVSKVFYSVGDRVKVGDILLVLEMEGVANQPFSFVNDYPSEKSGVISAIMVKLGDAVKKGDVLLTLKEA